MIKLNDTEKEFIQKIHLLSGYPIEEIREILESFLIQIIFNYMDGISTNLPLIGELQLNYIGDKIENGKKEAIIETKFELDKFLKKTIGQIHDGVETEIEKIFKKRIKNSLEQIIQNGE